MSLSPSDRSEELISVLVAAGGDELRERVAELIEIVPIFQLRHATTIDALGGSEEQVDLAVFIPASPAEVESVRRWQSRHGQTISLVLLADGVGTENGTAGDVRFTSEEEIPERLGSILGALQSVLQSRRKEQPGDKEKLGELSERELEVLRLTAKGLSVSEIAVKLHRSVNTVSSHRRSLHLKLGMDNRVELARFAIRNGLVEP